MKKFSQERKLLWAKVEKDNKIRLILEKIDKEVPRIKIWLPWLQLFLINEEQIWRLQLETLNAVAPLIEKEISLMSQDQTKADVNGKQKFESFKVDKILEELKKLENEPKKQ